MSSLKSWDDFSLNPLKFPEKLHFENYKNILLSYVFKRVGNQKLFFSKGKGNYARFLTFNKRVYYN